MPRRLVHYDAGTLGGRILAEVLGVWGVEHVAADQPGPAVGHGDVGVVELILGLAVEETVLDMEELAVA